MRVLILILLAVWCVERNSFWWDDVMLWKDSVSKHPLAPRAHNNLGFAYFRSKDLPSAEKEFLAAFTLSPGYADPLNNLAVIRSRLGRYKETLKLYETALRLSPNNPDFMFNIALTYDHLGMTARAVDEFKKIFVVAPCHARAHAQYGKILDRQGKSREAQDEFRTARACDPEVIIP